MQFHQIVSYVVSGVVLLILLGACVVIFLAKSRSSQELWKKCTWSPIDLDAIPEVTLSTDETCCVCMEQLAAGARARKLSCNHVFHGDCITSWWKKELWNKARAGAATVTCPMCRCAEPRALVLGCYGDSGEDESSVVARVSVSDSFGHLLCFKQNKGKSSKSKTFSLTAPTGSSLAVDAFERILWPDLSLKQICVAEPGGGGPKALVKDLQSPNSVAVGDGQVYWGDFGTRKIHKLSGSGSNEVIVPYGKNSTSLVVDTARGKLYWTNFGTNAIYRANLDGRDMQPLITDLESPSALALASKAGKLYWLERPRGKLRRASVEGSQVEDVLTNLPDPWALAVLDVGEASIVVPIEKYSWTDEGDVLKVYISESSNPAAIAAAGKSAGCLQVDFQPRGFTLTLGQTRWKLLWPRALGSFGQRSALLRWLE
eukprot:s1714_g2.t1